MEPISTFVSAKWLVPIAKELKKLHKQHAAELASIGDNFGDPLGLARAYVEPECQQYNPADSNEEDPASFVRSPVFKTINNFLAGDFAVRDGRQQLFVLSDAGMGKTSLLVMLKLTHLTSFWPKGYDCKLFKLGRNTLNEIQQIQNKSKTVLLLDSLDEDVSAFSRVEERLHEVLIATQHFRRVIISCRTQFFPEHNVTPFKTPGRVLLGTFQCPMIFLSLFSDALVTAYLAKRFRRTFFARLFRSTSKKHMLAKRLVGEMQSLRFRPLLLAHIDDLVDSQLPGLSEYSIYYALVQTWLLREERKLAEINHSRHVSASELLTACATLAREMWKIQEREATEEKIRELVNQDAQVGHLRDFDFGGRSLLNRCSNGSYRFSHFSIQEFLVTHSALSGGQNDHSLIATAQMLQFLRGWVNETENTKVAWSSKRLESVQLTLAIEDARSLRRRSLPSSTNKTGDGQLLTTHDLRLRDGLELVRVHETTVASRASVTTNDGLVVRFPNTLPAFYASSQLITNREFNHFAKATHNTDLLKDGPPEVPVTNISWHDADRFANWAGGRLLREAEWESLQSVEGMIPVPEYWEWCADSYVDQESSNGPNAEGPVSRRVMRRAGNSDERSRRGRAPGARDSNVGFRIARDPFRSGDILLRKKAE